MNPDEYPVREAKALMLKIDLSVPHLNEAYIVMEWLGRKPEVWIFAGASKTTGMYVFDVCPWDEAESGDADSDDWRVTISEAHMDTQAKTVFPQGWGSLIKSNHVRYVGHAVFIP